MSACVRPPGGTLLGRTSPSSPLRVKAVIGSSRNTANRCATAKSRLGTPFEVGDKVHQVRTMGDIEGRMNRGETIALWRLCEDARAQAIADGGTQEQGQDAAAAIWNEWADEMISQRSQLEAEGVFQIEMASRTEWHMRLPNSGLRALFPTNDATEKWHDNAVADFSDFLFEKEAGFSKFRFPGETVFIRSVFLDGALFDDVIFFHTANFMQSLFQNRTLFR